MNSIKTAFVFPGQGAQYAGMGKDLYDNCKTAREVFHKLEKLRPGTIDQCFYGDSESLAITENTQPCLYAVELSSAVSLIDAGIIPDSLAGFSVGEITALAISGAVSFEDGFAIVCKRASLMQKASDKEPASMLAVLKLSDVCVIDICNDFDNVYPVNFNCDGQVVVSGAKNALDLFIKRIKEQGGRAIRLKVSGGFHSPFMADAALNFGIILNGFTIKNPHIPLYSNVTSFPYTGDYHDLLKRQIESPVLWRQTIQNMLKEGINSFIEVGAGKTLCGFISRISDQARVHSVNNYSDLIKTIKEVLPNA